ncbi:MAG: Pvc16 family protein [Rhodobacter sp.]|nr:Pvc16 family protein [Rhodobacter sp.]
MQTSASHTAQVMTAVRERIQSLNTSLFSSTPITVEIGNPAQFHPRPESAPPLVTIWVYSIDFDNTGMLVTPDSAQALRLHTLFTAYCVAGATAEESAGTFELRILSHIIRLFMEEPEFGPIRIANALPIGPAADLINSDLMIEARPRSIDIEDTNHIWSTQGDTPQRTSVAYTFSFAIVTPSRPGSEGPPVIQALLEDPLAADPQEVGVRPEMPGPEPEPVVALGVLALQIGTPAAPHLVPEITFTAGGGDQVLSVVAVTEAEEELTLTLEVWDGANGWVDATVRLSDTSLTSLVRASLLDGGLIAPTDITLTDTGVADVLRLSAARTVEPETLSLSRVVITMEAP